MGKLTKNQKELLINHTKKVEYKRETAYNSDTECVLLLKKELRAIYYQKGKSNLVPRRQEHVLFFLPRILNNTLMFIDAVSDSYIYKHLQIFDKLCKENIYVDNYTNKKIIDRFSDVMWAMQQILFMSFDKRLAIFLYEETIKNNSNKIKLTHEQIAKYVGSAREVVTRMLNYFLEEKIVELSRGVVEVIDKEKLKEIIY